jgi:hypothetical protein
LWCSWRITRGLPDGRAQVGDRHLKFYEPRDNLQRGTLLDTAVWSVARELLRGLAALKRSCVHQIGATPDIDWS